MLALAIAVFIVVSLSAICSGTEAALFSISTLKVRQMIESGHKGAKILLVLRENMQRPISAIVVFNNISNIVGTLVVGDIMKDLFNSTLVAVGTAIFTLSIILFAEIVPKTLGEQYCEKVAIVMARPVKYLTWFFTPVLFLLEFITKPISKEANPFSTNEAQIRLLASLGQKEGIIEEDEGEMIQRVFELNDLTAGEILTPRVVMTTLSGTSTLDEAKETILNSTHSRIIIVGNGIDEILGFALKSDLLKGLIDDQGYLPLSHFVKEVRFVPKQIKADQLLINFRRSRQHLAVVLDEFGGVAGVVTLEDVMELLTGEIMDETDACENLQEFAKQQKLNQHVARMKRLNNGPDSDAGNETLQDNPS